jgi:hypothetical protein
VGFLGVAPVRARAPESVRSRLILTGDDGIVLRLD